MTTSIEDLEDIETLDVYLNCEDSIDVFDMTVPSSLRIDTINSFNNNIQIEYINKLTSMFTISGTTLLTEFIIEICNNSTINSTLKIECCKCLCIKDTRIIEHFNLLHNILTKYHDIPIPCRVLAIIFLTRCEKFKTDTTLDHFKDIIQNVFVECSYKYDMILSLQSVHNLDQNIYIYPLLMHFSQLSSLFTTHRILSCQHLLQNFKDSLIEHNHFEMIQNTLYSFASDDELDYNLRADATDILLGLGDEEHIQLARHLLLILGNRQHTIYDDQQNVHNSEIDDSCAEILNSLCKNKINSDICFENIKKICTKSLEDELKLLQQKLDNIQIALNRINIDRGLYGNSNLSLKSILLYLYNYIHNHEHEDTLVQRLKEELEEAGGKCSTGYIHRLMNVLSGFDNFSIKIGWDDEIIGKLSGRLNKLVNDIDDDDLKQEILYEMTMNKDNELIDRSNFLKLFRENIGSIKRDIWEDVKNDIDQTDFELYFRKAMSVYEGIDFF